MHLFYVKSLQNDDLRLENEEFRHCMQVLRHNEGDTVHISDGHGIIAEARLLKPGKREVSLEIISTEEKTKKHPLLHIAISPTKQMERLEWFVEKACEFGVDEITFVQCKNSERPRLKLDRLEKKAISALKQSKSGHKTTLHPLISFKDFIQQQQKSATKKMIAYVDSTGTDISSCVSIENSIILIGPEGDFTPEEVKMATGAGFLPVFFGQNVLRTETAGLHAASVYYYI
jgi:16S rRNA (uracil1498-N3)-methyltransferase